MKSRLYTRRGDDGTTSLVGGARAAKDSLRLEAYGTVDELNSWLGFLSTPGTAVPTEIANTIATVQNTLFDIGAILATEPESEWQPAPLGHARVEALEAAIDALDEKLPSLRQFILPAGHPDACRANIARTVARRAERRIMAMSRHTKLDPDIMPYINRLSDYLFAVARTINAATGYPETTWTQPK